MSAPDKTAAAAAPAAPAPGEAVSSVPTAPTAPPLPPDHCYALDVAVLSKGFASLDVMAAKSVHEVFLDPIPLGLSEFKNIFYSAGCHFGLTKLIVDHERYNRKISFLPKYRTFNQGRKFNLLECIIGNAETDLNVPRTCFTTASIVDVEKELANINTLYDVCCHHHHHHHHHHNRPNPKSIVCSLEWNDILQILRNQWKKNRIVLGAAVAAEEGNPGQLEQVDEGMFSMLVVTVIFKSCNACLLPTAVKFRYLIHLLPIVLGF